MCVSVCVCVCVGERVQGEKISSYLQEQKRHSELKKSPAKEHKCGFLFIKV